MLDISTFKTVVDATPLVSIDLIAEHDGKILLGKRKNRPARGYFFTTGGRIYKNERIDDALKRIAKSELGIDRFDTQPKFIGVFEHFYDDSIFESVSTHYINLAYILNAPNLEELPLEQHSMYRWFEVETLMQSDDVHRYVKDYFKKDEIWQIKK
jgi:colanic acid biosynthesis protein WcaH